MSTQSQYLEQSAVVYWVHKYLHTIYTLSTHYLHTNYSLSTQYLHSLNIWCSLRWCPGSGVWVHTHLHTIYLLSTHYLHTIYTLSIHYLHNNYTVSISGAVSGGVLGAHAVTRLLGEPIARGQPGNTPSSHSSAAASIQQPTPGRLSGSSSCSSWCRSRGKRTWNILVF